jgi:hypothetical protein
LRDDREDLGAAAVMQQVVHTLRSTAHDTTSTTTQATTQNDADMHTRTHPQHKGTRQRGEERTSIKKTGTEASVRSVRGSTGYAASREVRTSSARNLYGSSDSRRPSKKMGR